MINAGNACHIPLPLPRGTGSLSIGLERGAGTHEVGRGEGDKLLFYL